MKHALPAGAVILFGLVPGVALAQDATDYLRGSEVDLSITDDALQALYSRDARAVGMPGQELTLGLLLSEDRDIVGSAQIMVPATVNTGLPVTFKFGGKALAGLLDEGDDVVAFAPGIEARFNLSAGRPMGVVGNIFYAPDILTFGNADNVLDFNVRYEIGFTDQTTGYAGYRILTFDRDPGRGEDDIAEGLQIGVRFAF